MGKPKAILLKIETPEGDLCFANVESIDMGDNLPTFQPGLDECGLMPVNSPECEVVFDAGLFTVEFNAEFGFPQLCESTLEAIQLGQRIKKTGILLEHSRQRLNEALEKNPLPKQPYYQKFNRSVYR